MCEPTFNRTTALSMERTQNSLSQLIASKLNRIPEVKGQERGDSDGESDSQWDSNKSLGRRKSIMRVKTLDESLRFSSKSYVALKSDLSADLSSGTSSTSITSTSTMPSPPKKDKQNRKFSVNFSDICIRQYDLTIGDNPSCSRGAPVSLHWTYNPDHFICSFQKYEKFRRVNPPRKRGEMIIPMDTRHAILKEEWNISTRDILSIIKENKKIQEHRHKSALQTDRRIRNEALLENAKNSMRRLIIKGT